MNTAEPLLDLEFVRAQFPAFADPATSGWAHLENAGGSYVPVQVIELLDRFFRSDKVQPYWDFAPSRRAGEAMDRAIELIPATLGAPAVDVHFGPSTTQNTYVLAQAFRSGLVPGDEIVISEQDHEANIGCWERLASSGAVVKTWQVDPETGLLDASRLEDLLSEQTRIVAITHASNVAATRNPIAEIARRVHAVDARLIVDGVSHAPHAAVDVGELGCDAYLYSAYKTYGPHVGVMYVAPDLLESLPNQGHYFNEAKVHTRLVPAGPDHAEIAACAGIIDYYSAIASHHLGTVPADTTDMVRAVFDLFASHEQTLVTPLIDFLRERSGVSIVGSPSDDHHLREPTVAFHSDRVSSAAIYASLISANVACGHGHFYAHRLISALGLDPDDGVVRLSAVHYNTTGDVDRALTVLDAVL